ncbi:hypothetical protein F3Y22_tig00110674pilonHSYRG00172 [Hibiscus syriacus]|uniref:Uncharacterized protein n=1 Tax=Hibiscus syriacus TaxID=106335 RepID=A0A6A2ZXH7_HIBSY|nr:uncharacterized protein LOC120137508 [Hibiscus syriacus]KAE8696433.1 hypothetical protein F3Y22_tig00110674pilonHSYRG00172 [Hibiscus syriacus]
MAPHAEAVTSTYARTTNFPKPPRVSNDSLNRTVSDISFLTKDVIQSYKEAAPPPGDDENQLPAISEVEDAKCECCGMSEECTPEYIDRVRNKYMGKWICGLCSEAVKEEMEKIGGHEKIEEALGAHMNRCAKFNKFGRAYPALLTAEAMREILRKGSRPEGKSLRAKTFSHRDNRGAQNKGGIARSSSCIPAIVREMKDLRVAN